MSEDSERAYQAVERRMRAIITEQIAQEGMSPEAAVRVFFATVVAAGSIVCEMSRAGLMRNVPQIESLAIRYLSASINDEPEPGGPSA